MDVCTITTLSPSHMHLEVATREEYPVNKLLHEKPRKFNVTCGRSRLFRKEYALKWIFKISRGPRKIGLEGGSREEDLSFGETVFGVRN